MLQCFLGKVVRSQPGRLRDRGARRLLEDSTFGSVPAAVCRETADGKRYHSDFSSRAERKRPCSASSQIGAMAAPTSLPSSASAIAFHKRSLKRPSTETFIEVALHRRGLRGQDLGDQILPYMIDAVLECLEGPAPVSRRCGAAKRPVSSRRPQPSVTSQSLSASRPLMPSGVAKAKYSLASSAENRRSISLSSSICPRAPQDLERQRRIESCQ